MSYINFSVLFRLELNFEDFYGVLLQFEKRIDRNMQKINLELWIKGRVTEGATKGYLFKTPQITEIKEQD